MKNKPIRMCIICRVRYEQKMLIRFQFRERKLVEFTKAGRSSYICLECMKLDEGRVIKILNGRFKLNNKKLDEFGNIFPTKES